MIVMPSNNTCWLVHYWAGRYGNLGHLLGPVRVEKPYPHIPYALDNGAFGAWDKSRTWDPDAFTKHVTRYAFRQLRPNWVVVPDVVADRAATLMSWDRWAPVLRHEFMLPLALAVQDGMTISDVLCLSEQPDVIFVGGTTNWKWRTFGQWAKDFPRVHVGRVNGAKGLDLCKDAGVESCDGTGWFRGRPDQIKALGRFLAKQAGIYSKAEEKEICRVVYHSRLINNEQLALPLAGDAA